MSNPLDTLRGWTRVYRFARGPLLTVLVLLIVHLLARNGIEAAHPGPVAMVIVVFAALVDGLPSALTSAAIALAYSVLEFWTPGQSFEYTDKTFSRIIVFFFAAPLSALLVGFLRRRYIAALRQLTRSEALYRDLFDSAPFCLFEEDFSRSPPVIARANRQAEKVYGWTSEEFVSLPIERLVPPEVTLDLDLVRKAAAEGRSISIESINRKKDGSTFPVRIGVSISPVRGMKRTIVIVEDITDQKRLEDSLRLYKTVFECSLDGIAVVDREGKYLIQNPANEEMLGYSIDELRGLTPAIHLGGGRFREAMTELARHGSYRGELFSKRRDGREFILDLSAVQVKNEAGEVIGSVGIKRDVTEKKKTERALHESAERFQVAVQGSYEGIWDCKVGTNGDWRAPETECYYSPRAKELIGYRDNELTNTLSTWFYLCHPADLHRVIAEISAHMHEGALFDTDMRLKTKAGEYRWFSARGQAVLVTDGKAVRMAGSIRDITEKRTADEALRQSEERFRQLAENIREVFWMTDPEKKEMIYVSPAYEEIWGRSREELYAKPRSFIDAIHPDDRGRVLERLPSQKLGNWEEEYRIVRPNGSVRWIRARAFPVLDKSGRVYRVAGLSEDITQRKLIDAKLVEQSRMASVGQMAAGVAHEIRNPLFGISNVAQILSKEEFASPQVRELFDMMLGEIGRLKKLLEDLLLYSRPRKLETLPTDIAELCNDTFEFYGQLASAKNLGLTRSFEPFGAKILVDSERMRQVLLNLYLNALQASPEGGIIEIESVIRRAPSPEWYFQIRNHGDPIQSAHLTKVFEPFFSTRKEGSGLGLAVCRRIVEDHGGKLQVESTPERGTLFTFHVPTTLVDNEDMPVAIKGGSFRRTAEKGIGRP